MTQGLNEQDSNSRYGRYRVFKNLQLGKSFQMGKLSGEIHHISELQNLYEDNLSQLSCAEARLRSPP